jgi:5-methylcytosine-specific restriction endonuclease McrA
MVRGASARVLVLNATYEPINVCTVRRAAVLILKSKAEVLEESDGALRSERMSMQRPTVIRLVTYVRIRKPGLTVDHVIPRSRGGKSVWENIVASCASCNRRKGNRLPREIKMHPRTRPTAPGPTVFIRIASPTIPQVWQQYLPAMAA